MNNEISIHFEIGHTTEEWEELCSNSNYGQALENDYWDFSIDDLLNGAVEPDKDMIYWLIDGRLYETPSIV